ncbi:MAG TPA: 2-oxo acid dehydrogenase subunit E2 [Gemmataceae bacterium]|nr:2-oxo acid dehydrogenase subunit E2 [Gemmataceae bacterium]
MTDPQPSPAYDILPRNKFFDANRSIVEYEIRPGNTVTFLHEVDLTEVEAIRDRAAKAGRKKPSYTAFVVKAVALALRDFPYANRRLWSRRWLPLIATRLQQFHRIDVAVACERDAAEVSTFADIIRDADRQSLDALTEWLHNLATCDATTNKQWREFSTGIRKLPHWLSKLIIRLPYLSPKMWIKWRGGAVLISSPAKYGVDVVSATWSWPLGISFGVVKPRPVVRNGEVVAAPTFILTLNFDRRVMAGAQAARFFKRMLDVLDHAETEMAAYLDTSVSSHLVRTQPGEEVVSPS